MRMRFIGKYQPGQTEITFLDHTFVGNEAREVSDTFANQLVGHPELEVIHPLDRNGDGRKGGSLPRKRGKAKPDGNSVEG
jgi:hypothetical protein